MICEICGREFENFGHIFKSHNISINEYYDIYLKKENEGICLKCGKKTKYINVSIGYRKFCSRECSNIESKDKIKQTNIKKYGVGNGHNKKVQEKCKQTSIEKYGCENPNQNEEIKEKIKRTNIEKYRVEHPLQNEEIKEKIKQTNIEKYGVENPSQNKEIREKKKHTYLNKFLPKVLELLKNSNLELLSEYNNNKELIKIQCKNCNSIFETQYDYIKQGHGRCPICFPKYKSNGEIELSEFIKSLNLEIIENDHKILNGKELDTYIPLKNIAIEFDGLYWHSEEQGKDKNYHLNKTELCLSKNIQLIHIFEDEWIFKNDIVKSRLKQLLNLNNNLPKIHARKCKIRNIDPKTKNEFLDKYHIQGKDNSSIKLGAFYNDKLISLMTFSKGNISKGSKNIEGIYELSRFCSDYNYHIIGIASKLLSYFKKNYEWKGIYSYADRRWSLGNLYYQIGFKLNSITKPNYFYIKEQKRIHRFNLRKKYNEPKDIPEWILRSQEGYHRIYDCGHLKFKMINEDK